MSDFKVGDPVKRMGKSCHATIKGGTYTVSGVRGTRGICLDGGSYSYDASAFELVTTPDTSQHHPHHDVIVAWAKGAKVQELQELAEEWATLKNPNFYPHLRYRVAPALTPQEEEIEALQERVKQLETILWNSVAYN